jgi:hypothetical protein
MSKENGLSEKITDSIIEIIKKSSLFDKILTLTNKANKANKTLYSVGGFCLVVTLCTVANYNKTQKIVDIIQTEIVTISDLFYKKNKNIGNLDINVANIQEDIARIKNDIYEMKVDLKNLLLLHDFIRHSEKTLVERATSINSLDFLNSENSCRENVQELSIQTENIVENIVENNIEYNIGECNNEQCNNEQCNTYKKYDNDTKIEEDIENDIMNECYDIIPCNNIKKYSNNKYNLFF